LRLHHLRLEQHHVVKPDTRIHLLRGIARFSIKHRLSLSLPSTRASDPTPRIQGVSELGPWKATCCQSGTSIRFLGFFNMSHVNRTMRGHYSRIIFEHIVTPVAFSF
jgi:hypothetical protein